MGTFRNPKRLSRNSEYQRFEHYDFNYSRRYHFNFTIVKFGQILERPACHLCHTQIGKFRKSSAFLRRSQNFAVKVHIFWEGHKILWNLHLTFDWHYIGQKLGEDLKKFCGLLRIYYQVHIFWEGHKILRNLHLTFDWHYIEQKQGEHFAKFCGLLRIL